MTYYLLAIISVIPKYPLSNFQFNQMTLSRKVVKRRKRRVSPVPTPNQFQHLDSMISKTLKLGSVPFANVMTLSYLHQSKVLNKN